MRVLATPFAKKHPPKTKKKIQNHKKKFHITIHNSQISTSQTPRSPHLTSQISHLNPHHQMITPAPPRYHNSSWQLLSQGAEARVWFIPNFLDIHSSSTNSRSSSSRSSSSRSSSSRSSNSNTCNSSNIMNAICKERFAKSYRHPVLNDTLTKARTKAEARSLTRCRRGGVSVPILLGVDMNPNCTQTSASSTSASSTSASSTSACLFMEMIQGCTLRSFLTMTNTCNKNQSNNNDTNSNSSRSSSNSTEEPCTKRIKLDNDISTNANYNANDKDNEKDNATRLDEYAKKVAHATGIAIGKMHNVNIIHGDLTTSNIFLRNPPPPPPPSPLNNDNHVDHVDDNIDDWKPDIVMIDFGLSTTSVNSTKKKGGNNTNNNISSSSSCHEERAVDLYVLERAFVTTHVGGELLVDEILRGYKKSCMSSDSVLQRLSVVRLRGRKRECFG